MECTTHVYAGYITSVCKVGKWLVSVTWWWSNRKWEWLVILYLVQEKHQRDLSDCMITDDNETLIHNRFQILKTVASLSFMFQY